jgi:phosphinothricin acetyltransferase
MDLRIELADEAALPRIVDIMNWAAEHTAANFALEPEPLEMWADAWQRTHRFHPWFVARTDGAIIGFAKSSPHRVRKAYDWFAEVTVYIDPAFHGKRIGTALYERLLPTLDAQGYTTLLAGIVGGHAASERLHERFGFERCGTFHRAGWKFQQWHDVGYWQKALRGADYVPTPVRPVGEAV